MTGSHDHDEGRDRRQGGWDPGRDPDWDPDRGLDWDGARDGDLTARLGGGRGPDPLEPLLRPSVPHLQAPPGAYDRIRRTAARRRRTRALLSGGAAAAVVAGALYVGGSLTSGGGNDVIGPPAGSPNAATTPPRDTTPAVTPSPAGTTPTGSTGAPGTPPDSTPPTGGTGSAQPPGNSPTSPTPSGHGTPMCTASQLTAALGGGDAGAGNLYRYLVLTNHDTAACHLAGYPGLSMLDANGRQIGQPATREPSSYQPVVLQPGESASDTIHTANQQGTCLPESASLRIYPPGSLDALVVPGRITECEGVFAITPFGPGSTGNPPG